MKGLPITTVVLTSLLFLAGLGPAYAAGVAPHKELVAVLEFDMAGGSKAEASAITESLREALFRTGKFTLVDRSQMKTILGEQAFQQTGCTSQECAVKVGQILGIKQIVAAPSTRSTTRSCRYPRN